MHWFSNRRFPFGRRTALSLGAVLVVAVLAVAGTATAAEIAGDQTYHLAAGETISDDLVVFGEDIVIDGTVEGDLVAFGQFVTVNGIVNGDVIAAAAEVQINGIVEDDVRAGGAALRVNGRIGDDLFAAAGGFIPGFGEFPMPMGDRAVVLGMSSGPEATVGGDAFVAAGEATLEGAYRRNLSAAAGQLTFNAQVDGDATLEADTLIFGDSANVAGDLTYTASSDTGKPEAGGAVTKSEPKADETGAPDRGRNPIIGFGWWFMRTLLVIAGIVLLGLVLLMLSRGTLTGPADAIKADPLRAGLFGVVIVVAAVPLSAALVFLAGLFFGWFWGGVAAFMFLAGFWLLAWVLSPVVTGLWLDRQIFDWTNVEQGDALALVVGASLIVLVGRTLGAIPCAGVLAYLVIYLLSFVLAAGGVLMSRREQAAGSTES